MKKGFSLIELLAIIIILGLITLIIIPSILEVIDELRTGSAEDSSLYYVQVVEDQLAIEHLGENQIGDGDYITSDDLSLLASDNYKGKKIEGKYRVYNKKVINGTFCINGFSIYYNGLESKRNNTADFCNGNYEYNMTEKDPMYDCFSYDDYTEDGVEGIQLTKLNNCDVTDFIIPTTIDGKKVISIKSDFVNYVGNGGYIHYTKSFSSIDLNFAKYIKNLSGFDLAYDYDGNGTQHNYIFDNLINLEKISDYTFSGNDLGYVDLSKFNNLKEISDRAFTDTSITSIKFPNNIELINDYAFSSSNIGFLDLSNSNKLSSLGYGTFSYAKIASLKLPVSITTIEDFVFSGTEFGDLDISYLVNVEEIGDLVFDEAKFSSLKLPNNIKKINWFAFHESTIGSLDLTNCEKLEEIGQGVFEYSKINSIKLPNSLKTIKRLAFFGIENLITITTPPNVETIEESAFEYDKKLTKIVNKTGRTFNWKSILDPDETKSSCSPSGNFITGYCNIYDYNLKTTYRVDITDVE